MTVPARASCPTCGATLDGAGTGAFCAACMWQAFAEAAPEEGSIDSSAAPPDAFFRVPGHDVLAEIARGGGGIVYRARQREPRREVALKMLLPHQLTSEELLARFRVEAETVALLDHPAVLPVYTVGEHHGMPYFTMKLATGGTLGARAAALRGNWRAIAGLMVTLAEAVQFAHAHGVIHRDLKPGNVLFDEQDRAYVSDFGLAKFVNAESSVTRTAAMFGTPAYLAPELIASGVSAATIASDVYGLGAILYELLCGRPPYAGAALPVLLQRVIAEAPPAPRRHDARIPRDLEVICQRAMARAPRQRFASAQELAIDLQRWLDGRTIESRPSSGLEEFWRWTRRHPTTTALGATLALVLVGGAIMLTRSNHSMRLALNDAQIARATSQELLRSTLISEGRLKRQSGKMGQRYAALESLERAARISPSLELRNEVAAALASPDVRLLRTAPAGLSTIYSMIDFHPDLNTYLAPDTMDPTGGSSRVLLRSFDDGRVLRTFPPRAAGAVMVRYSGDGRRFVARHWDFTREFWAVEGEEPLFREGPLSRLGWVGDALHPSLPRVALQRNKNELHLRDLRSQEERLLYRAPDEIMKIAFSPDGGRLALVSHERVEVIDAETGALLWALDDDTNGVDPAWSPDGTRLAWSRTRNNLANVVADAGTGAIIAELFGHREIQVWFEFSPDGGTLYSMARDQTLRQWDIARGRQTLLLDVPACGFAISPDGTKLAATMLPGSAVLYDMTPSGVFEPLHAAPPRLRARSVLGLATAAHHPWVVTLTFALDYTTATGGGASMQVVVWDQAQRREIARFSNPITASVYENEACTALFAPGDDAIYYGSLSAGTWRRTIVQDATGGTRLGEPEPVAHAGPGILLKVISRNGDWFVHDHPNGKILVWPGGDAERARVVLEYRDFDLMLEVTPDGQWFAAATTYHDNVIRVGATNGDLSEVRQLPMQGAKFIHLSPDGRRLFGANRTEVLTWDMPGLEPGPTWSTPSDGDNRRSLAFSPDGRWLASAAARGVVEIRDAQSLERKISLEAPTEFQRCAWSADGSQLYLVDVAGGETRLFRWNMIDLRRELDARGLDW